MRSGLASLVAAAGLLAAATALAAPSTKAAALAAGDWLTASKLGASAAEVVTALQAKGQYSDEVPTEAVVVISPDNTVEVVGMKPLPPLPGHAAGRADTANLSGSAFDFGARPGSVILYPPEATTFSGGRTPKP